MTIAVLLTQTVGAASQQLGLTALNILALAGRGSSVHTAVGLRTAGVGTLRAGARDGSGRCGQLGKRFFRGK
ncbi:hypothetical protein Strvi_5590 [Streptomyces violaceusniger Tu 4113]|uniref:Uncharacterized protein n=1 Tax=Streptomyces violaceusniger (strain Tu 4113) TaxID=653045 RepID=G2PFV4_STRV4|nr:hypothetical protein Strvi_5590 [Streptomyces violaceusniger Tu 4113]